MRRAAVRTWMERSARGDAGQLVVGMIVEVSPDREVIVNWPANSSGPVAARLLNGCMDGIDTSSLTGMTVLLAFDEDPRPVVLGRVIDKLDPETSSRVAIPQSDEQEVTVDGRKVVLEGKKEVALRCGRSEIVLRADGKVLIKGTQVVSRATRTNALKGGTVRIN